MAIEISAAEKADLLEDAETTFIESKFGFLKGHNGIRPGELHTLISTSGAGKTTLTRSIINETACQVKTALWQSEEKEKDFKLQAVKGEISKRALDNLVVFSEQDHDDVLAMSPKQILIRMWDFVKEHRPEVLFIDNLTTSTGYMDMPSADQAEFSKGLKIMADRTGVGIFAIAHTESKISIYNQGLINGNNIRGNKTIVNLSPYLYIFQRIVANGASYPFVNVEKSRAIGTPSKLYALEYNKNINLYTGDFELEFEDLKKIYRERSVL